MTKEQRERRETIVIALTEFVLRASKEKATAEEVAALPAVAEILAKYHPMCG